MSEKVMHMERKFTVPAPGDDITIEIQRYTHTKIGERRFPDPKWRFYGFKSRTGHDVSEYPFEVDRIMGREEEAGPGYYQHRNDQVGPDEAVYERSLLLQQGYQSYALNDIDPTVRQWVIYCQAPSEWQRILENPEHPEYQELYDYFTIWVRRIS